jgi:hypothetical protein
MLCYIRIEESVSLERGKAIVKVVLVVMVNGASAGATGIDGSGSYDTLLSIH